LPCCNTNTHKRLQRVFHRKCNYTAHAVKQRTGIYSGFFCYSPCFAPAVWLCIRLYYTACATLERITAPQHLHRYQIPPPRRTLYSSAQPPYYNKVYKRSADHASPAAYDLVTGQPGALHPAGQSSGRGARRRGTIDGCRRISFRAFAR
jgi:hypothetical protein